MLIIKMHGPLSRKPFIVMSVNSDEGREAEVEDKCRVSVAVIIIIIIVIIIVISKENYIIIIKKLEVEIIKQQAFNPKFPNFIYFNTKAKQGPPIMKRRYPSKGGWGSKRGRE